MKKVSMIGILAFTCLWMLVSCAGGSEYAYESVSGDPMQTRIYTLPNGLKVYMTENHETPRIQTYIAVKVGGKNDPSETTGLAHYFEHLMFKGTDKFGTQNYELEKPLLDQIEAQFEVYRKTTDSMQRIAIYKTIDSLSFEASKLAIPNEYDKLMSAIGASGTNAYTGYDQTVYVEDIPSNEVDNWAGIQAERFTNNVIRGFHTELETVYEEKNMSLTKDNRKVMESLMTALFPNHPYGTQTVLGTQEDLKNPSITNIKNYYKTYYVPNNMAICLSGDFDSDSMIRVIDRYFGSMKPNDSLPEFTFTPEPPITRPVVKEVLGVEAPNILLAWRMPSNSVRDREILSLLSSVLYNGSAGLIDLDINQRQQMLGGYASPYDMADYTSLVLGGTPKTGQSLDEVKDLLFAEVAKLKSGDFDEELLEATINNYKRGQMAQLESNKARADMFVNSFINGTDWADEVKSLDRMSKLTKADIVRFANENLGDSSYVAIYKRQGKDPNEKKIAKPAITPIYMNRDTASAFLRAIQIDPVTPIEPRFVDFSKDMQQAKTKSGLPVLYAQNQTNGLFSVTYLIEMGGNEDKTLSLAAGYLDYLGAGDLTPEQIQQEFYRLACSFNVSTGAERTYVTLSGLDENMEEAMALFEKILADPKPDSAALSNLKNDILKSRADAKLNQSANFSALRQYAVYGPNSPARYFLSAEELAAITPEELTDRIRKLFSFEHKVLYYGPRKPHDFIAVVDKLHTVPSELTSVPKNNPFVQQPTPSNKVLIAPYDAKQIYLAGVSNRGETFDESIYPQLTMYNEYFGGGMNSIVFQEMRESRALAYSAGAGLSEPGKPGDNYTMNMVIATQNDKMGDALAAFDEIINDMPESEQAFKLAKDGLIARLRTSRTTGSQVLWYYLDLQRKGLDRDRNEQLFNDVQNMTLADIKAFQEKWVKDRSYTYCILGDEKELDLKALQQYGPVTRLTTEDIFGY